MANTTTYIHLHTNINKNKNNDDYTNNHCIEILFLVLVLVSFSRIERLHWIFVTINLCVVLVCLRFALQYSEVSLKWIYKSTARAFIFSTCIMKSMEQEKRSPFMKFQRKKWIERRKQMTKSNNMHTVLLIPQKNIHRIGFYTAICYHLLSLNVLYFSLYIEFLCTNLYIYFV